MVRSNPFCCAWDSRPRRQVQPKDMDKAREFGHVGRKADRRMPSSPIGLSKSEAISMIFANYFTDRLRLADSAGGVR
jgi:hypothetical protein